MSLYIVASDRKEWWAKFGAFLLRSVEGTDFSHVSLAFKLNGDMRIAESVFPKFRFQKYDEWSKSYQATHVYELKVTDEQFSSILAYAATHESKPYSLLQLANIALKRMLPFFARGLNHENALICSEFVARSLSKAFSMPHIDDFDSVGLLEIQRVIDALVTMGLANEKGLDEWLA